MALVILPPGSTSIELQAAINNAAFGDVIQISSDMPFMDTVTDRLNVEITIQSGTGNHWTMYQFSPGNRHFEITGSIILGNITLDGRSNGGGVRLNQGAFTMQEGAVIQNCSAENGGGVEVVRGVFSIYGGEIQNNTAKNGGGVYLGAGMFNMSASPGIISENQADKGGGVYVNSGTYRLTGGEIINNEAQNGGGLYINSGTLSMNRGNFINNKAIINGGGIYASSLATLEIAGTASAIIRNSAANGGGIYTEDGTYGNLITGSNLVFRCNKAQTAYMPPEDAEIRYPDIQFAETTIRDHPLNNYDINYTEGNPAAAAYNVIYDANGGVGSHTGSGIEPCEADIVLTLEETGISRECYTFTGWNTEPDGSGTSYAPGDEIELTDNEILYAQWEAMEHPCGKGFCDKFSKEFSREFCNEFTGGCCKKCCHLCCKTTYNLCNKICKKLCDR